MRKTLIIALLVSVGLLVTACTTSSPDVKGNNQKAGVSDEVVDTTLNVAKGAAVAAATKEVSNIGSSKKKTKK